VTLLGGASFAAGVAFADATPSVGGQRQRALRVALKSCVRLGARIEAATLPLLAGGLRWAQSILSFFVPHPFRPPPSGKHSPPGSGKRAKPVPTPTLVLMASSAVFGLEEEEDSPSLPRRHSQGSRRLPACHAAHAVSPPLVPSPPLGMHREDEVRFRCSSR
jgi:hypothetical protein